jgi:hypothetical protein
MATNFPTSVDALTNPVSNDSLNSPSHSAQHANANDAIEAVETYLIGRLRIKQIVTGFTTTAIGSSSSTFADTGLTATITPSSATSNILVFIAQNGLKKINNTSMNLRALRGATVISNFGIQVGYTNTALELVNGGVSTMIYDSPATTSATTYKTQFSSQANIGFVDAQFASVSSSIVLVEIEV